MTGTASLRAAEQSLQRAQLASDVAALDRLLHPSLTFVGPDGALSGKPEDLEAHRSGAMHLDVLEPQDLVVRVADGVGVTVLTAHLAGQYGGRRFSARMRYTRSWARGPEGWRIVAAQAGVLEPLGDRSRESPPPGMHIEGLDHLVLTVSDLGAAMDFYERVLGMRPVRFGDGRYALTFGNSKLNLHGPSDDITPRAAHATPGSADLCLLTSATLEQILAHLGTEGVEVDEGPVRRTGARGPITSVYIRDPDRNLIEISRYDTLDAGI